MKILNLILGLFGLKVVSKDVVMTLNEADCSDLSNQINSKEVYIKDLESIVGLYDEAK